MKQFGYRDVATLLATNAPTVVASCESPARGDTARLTNSGGLLGSPAVPF